MVRGVLIALVAALAALIVLLIARRHRQPAWLLPAFVGAILSGVSVAGVLSLWDLVRIVQSVRVSGSGGLAAFGQGLWEANQTWRTGLQVALVASGVLGLKYFLHPRRTASSTSMPRVIPVFFMSLVPLFALAIAFAIFRALNVDLWAHGQSSYASPESAAALVTSRGWLIAAASMTATLFCGVNVVLSPVLRKPGPSSPAVQRASAAFLAVVVLFVLVALGMLIAWIRDMAALATY